MMLAYLDNGSWTLWTGQPVNGVKHPRSVAKRWTDAELEAAGLYRVTDDPVPDGKVATGGSFEDRDGGPVRVPTPIDRTYSTNDVRAEADRKMVALLGARDSRHKDVLISNAQREAIRLLHKGEANWTPEEAARVVELQQIDAALEAIRAASNVLEAMDPIPADFADDANWPVFGP